MHYHRSGFRVAAAAALVAAAAMVALPGQAEAQAQPELPAATDGHRVLRDNAPGGFVPPTEPGSFGGFPDAPDFTVVPRQDELSFYPCAMCHSALPSNPEPRKLMAPHPAALNHGDGRFWCLDCHDAEDRNLLQTFAGDDIGFNDAYLVCGQCHYAPQKDWYFGAHGKRVGNWQGDRSIYNCTHCHDPHDPSVKSRVPEPPPPVRRGLEPMQRMHHETAPYPTDTATPIRDHEDDETTPGN